MNIVIADSDALIGLIYEADLLHQRSVKIFNYLQKENSYIFIPYPILLEAATGLARIAGRADLAAQLLKSYVNSGYKLDMSVEDLVAELYDPKTSKKNTPFDHYVLALAKKNDIKYVFSFDSFYKKNGLTLMEDVV